MLNPKEFNHLEELKKKFIKELKVIDYEFTDEELQNIFNEIEKYPSEERTLQLWRQIIQLLTNARQFYLFEALEVSDINYIHQQIQDLLNKK